jgi:hypothetical protein
MALTKKAYSNNFEGLDACVLLEQPYPKVAAQWLN